MFLFLVGQTQKRKKKKGTYYNQKERCIKKKKKIKEIKLNSKGSNMQFF